MKVLFKLAEGGSDLFKKDSMDVYFYVLVLFIIKVFLVQYSYNVIAPRLIMNWQDKQIKNFRPLSFLEAALAILIAIVLASPPVLANLTLPAHLCILNNFSARYTSSGEFNDEIFP